VDGCGVVFSVVGFDRLIIFCFWLRWIKFGLREWVRIDFSHHSPKPDTAFAFVAIAFRRVGQISLTNEIKLINQSEGVNDYFSKQEDFFKFR
jgi:hypothetical protein